jgi:hypothetical protein
MNHDENRLPSNDLGIWFADDLPTHVHEAFGILLNECRRQSERQTIARELAATGQPAKAQLKLVRKKERA